MCKNLTYIFIPLFLFLSFKVLATEYINIDVDASKDLGSVPDILSSSVWIAHASEKDTYILNKFFNENRPATIQLTMPLGGNDFESFKKNLRDYLSNEGASIIIKKAKEYNTTFIIGFDPAPMRSWLSLRASDYRKIGKNAADSFNIEQTSPPANYQLWAEVVKETLNYFKNDLGVRNLGFYVGHEPNRDWLGSEESFFRYYESAARAAKGVSETILVGGIGPWSVDAKKAKCNDKYYPKYVKDLCNKEGGWADPEGEPMLKNFIEYVVHHRIPLDFINWHSFGLPPEKFIEAGQTVGGWVRDAGIDDKKVILYPSDWTYWAYSYPADYLDTQEGAAYIVHALYYMGKAGIGWHGHDFNVFNDGSEEGVKRSRQNATFIGDWSIFTRAGRVGGGIIKPMYNVMKALSIATGGEEEKTTKLISTEFPEGEGVIAFSTITDNRKRLSILVSNFIPRNEKRLRGYILDKIKSQAGFLEEEKDLIKKCVEKARGDRKGKEAFFLQCIDELIPTLKDPKKIEAMSFIKDVYTCFNNKMGLDCILDTSRDLKYPETRKLADTIRSILDAGTKSRQLQVYFTNIPFEGKVRLTTYVIDGTHSNACSFNKRTELIKTQTPCGIGGAIDCAVWDAKEKAQKGGIKTAEDYLLSLGYKESEVKYLKDIIKKYEKSGNIKLCLNKLLKDRDFKPTCSVKKLEEDLKETFKIYHKALHSFYYNAIDEINNWYEVSLEGLKEEREVEIKKGGLTVGLVSEPNSVYLLVLESN